MHSVKSAIIPENGLIQTYASQKDCYVDCYYTDVPKHVRLEEFIVAFFTTPVFRLERKLLGIFASRPSTDTDVKNLAQGSSDVLAFWKIELREDNQLLLAVVNSPIRSWLMIAPLADDANQTRLYFGSVVLPKINKDTGEAKMGLLFNSLLGFHKVYSKILLSLAKRRLLANR